MRVIFYRCIRNRTCRKLGPTKLLKRLIIPLCGIILFCVLSLTIITRTTSVITASITRRDVTNIKTTTNSPSGSMNLRNSTGNSMWTKAQKSIGSNRLFLTASYYGRLGNRMFIYASLIGLAKAQDREPFMKSGGHLEPLFQVSHIRDDVKPDNWTIVYEVGYATFNSKFMKLAQQNITIYGMFQSWKYFQHIHEEIRREFTFKADIQKKVQTKLSTYRNRHENHVLVGVHVRRGDFLSPRYIKDGYGVANASYFVNAFAKMRSLLTNQNITFLIGSDDLDWCRNNINDSDIEILPQGSPADHFAILSSCDHVIITGGTFGWWIGWLANGVTIYYKNFITKNSSIQNGFVDQDYYPLGWIGLDN